MGKTTKRRDKDHDSFIRGILASDKLVKKLLYRYIPLSTQPFIDFDSLSFISDMHTDSKLKSSQSDSIHECRLKRELLPEEIRNNAHLPIFRFCFLWEHKSDKPNEPIEFQVEKYRYSLIHEDLKNKKMPSIIIPIILYHGKEKWDKKMIYDRLSAYLPPEIMVYVSYPKYVFIDLQAVTDQEIEDLVDLEELRAAFIALKHGYNKDFFKQDMKKVLNFVEDKSSTYLFREFFKMLLEYMQRRSELEEKEFTEIIQQILEPDMATQFKTIFELADERSEARAEAKVAAATAAATAAAATAAAAVEAKFKESLRKAVLSLIRTTALSDAQIAEEMDLEVSYIKSIRLEMTEQLKKKH
jgi:Putative transposase, YhgA-like